MIDTKAKRSSALNWGGPWRAMLPPPDGTIAQGDRQAVAFLYSGILASAAVADVEGVPCLVAGQVYFPGVQRGAIYKPGIHRGEVVCDG